MTRHPSRPAMFALPVLLLALPAAPLLPGCKSVPQYHTPADALAVYSYTDHVLQELVALRPGGEYVQAIGDAPRNPASSATRPRAPLPNTVPHVFRAGYAHTGTWRLLDKPGGRPLALSAVFPSPPAALPPTAVIELHQALPFGLVWENQPQNGLYDETLPVAEFRPAKP